MTTGKIECLCTYYWHQFPAPWHDVHRSSDGAHQLSGGAIELHSQGLPVADQKQQRPPDVPVGRGPAGVGLGAGLREIVGRGVALLVGGGALGRRAHRLAARKARKGVAK